MLEDCDIDFRLVLTFYVKLMFRLEQMNYTQIAMDHPGVHATKMETRSWSCSISRLGQGQNYERRANGWLQVKW